MTAAPLAADSPVGVTPRPHQREAIAAAVAGLRAPGTRGCVVMACGTGKTLVGQRVAEAVAVGPVLVVVPSIALAAQTARSWLAEGARQVRVFCSDAPAGRVDDPDLPVAELPVEASTAPERLVEWVTADSAAVIVATYSSLVTVAAAHRGHGLGPWSLVVFDEAHRCAGAATSAWRIGLHDDAVPAQRRLFLTATPKVFAAEPDAGDLAVPAAGAAAADVWGEAPLSSMDDEALFGRRLFTLGFGEAIRRGLLADYQVLVVGVSDVEVHRLVADRSPVQAGDDVLDAGSAAAQVALCQAARDHGLRKVLVFHPRVAQSMAFTRSLPVFADLLPDSDSPPLPVRTAHIDGTTPASAREAILRDVGDEDATDHWSVLSNARCLSEGVDIPTMDAVMFCGTRGSQIDVVQAVGRALRLHPAKTGPATIVLPVLIADGEADEAVLAGSPFRAVWQVLRALRDHDETFEASLTVLRPRPPHGSRPHPVVELGPRLRLLTTDRHVELFVRGFRARLARSLDTWWPDGLVALTAFRDREGHVAVPRDHVEGGHRLGDWVSNRRVDRKVGRLSQTQIDALDDLGMVWQVQRSEWDEALQALTSFRAREGHLDVPFQHVENGHRLGRWVSRQRQFRRTGDRRLTEDRVRLLTEMGLDWAWGDVRREQRWEQCVGAVAAFRARTGGLVVPDGHIERGVKLGAWMSSQRRRFARGVMSEAEVADLMGVGFDPSVRGRSRRPPSAGRGEVADGEAAG